MFSGLVAVESDARRRKRFAFERSPLSCPLRQKAVPAPYGENVLSSSCSVTTQVTETKSLVVGPSAPEFELQGRSIKKELTFDYTRARLSSDEKSQAKGGRLKEELKVEG